MSDIAIEFRDVGKMYKIFATRRDNLFDALGLQRFIGERPDSYQEFWALREIDLTLRRGERLGIVGRNGAGKSTLLKLVTGNMSPTTGSVEVHGEVQALLEIGGGLHPEFTGRENIRAALSFMGLNASEIESSTREIAGFTELGRFLDQPFKTYSTGMQARLSIGIATCIRPEILIVDEILGAGDAYFFAKSTARMKQMLEGGASVLLVSHALDQVIRFCDEAIWLDRGRIVMRGASTDVVKAYERFIRDLDDQRLRAHNRKALAGFDAFERDSYTEALSAHVAVPIGSTADIRGIRLLRDGVVEESVAVGDAQDADTSQSAAVVLTGSSWSPPCQDTEGFFRAATGDAGGVLIFNLWFWYPDSRYSIELDYRTKHEGIELVVRRGSHLEGALSLSPSASWQTAEVLLAPPTIENAEHEDLSRWAGLGGLRMNEVRIVDQEDVEQAVLVTGHEMSVRVEVEATEAGAYRIIPAALVFSADGSVVTRHVGEPYDVPLERSETFEARLDLGPLLLGNGAYLLSVGLYRTLDASLVEESTFYDYFDRSFEFRVVGNPPLHTELVRHPGAWTIERSAARVVEPASTPSQAERIPADP